MISVSWIYHKVPPLQSKIRRNSSSMCNQNLSRLPDGSLLTYISKLKDLRKHLRVCLWGDSSCVSVSSMLLHPASPRAVNAPHTSSRYLLFHVGLMSSRLSAPGTFRQKVPLIFLLSALHVLKGLLTFLWVGSTPTCSLFPGDSSHLCPSPWRAYPVLKSTPDDFFFFFFPPLHLQPLYLPSNKCHHAQMLPTPLLCSSLSLAPWQFAPRKHASMHSPPLASLLPFYLPKTTRPLPLFVSTEPQKCCELLSLTLTDPLLFPLSLAPSDSSRCLPMGEKGAAVLACWCQALPLSCGFTSAPLALLFLMGEWWDRASFTHVIPLDSVTLHMRMCCGLHPSSPCSSRVPVFS